MIDIGEIEIYAENIKVLSGGPWAPDGIVRETVIEGGVKRLSELANDPPEGVHVVAVEFSDLLYKVTMRPVGPAGLRALADALEQL